MVNNQGITILGKSWDSSNDRFISSNEEESTTNSSQQFVSPLLLHSPTGISDIMRNVFSYLKFGDLCSAMSVCRDWKECILDDESLLKNLPIQRARGHEFTGWIHMSKLRIPCIVQRAAELGNLAAMQLFAEELEIRGQNAQAFYWYKKAGRKGSQVCQYRVGEAFYRGDLECPRDGEEALAWLLWAFKNSNGTETLKGKAAILLGYMYLDGDGLQPSNSDAVKWFKEARDRGCTEAEQTMGWMWNTGQY